MPAFQLSCVGLLLLVFSDNALAQPRLIPVNLPDLRTGVANLLLQERDGPRAVIVDHLWKSNGGTLIPRDEHLLAARLFADQLTARIQYDPETETLVWPVIGFAGRSDSQFDPLALWTVPRTYLTDHRFEDADILALETKFLAVRPAVVDPLTPPSGLTLPADTLLLLTGYHGTRLFVYSPSNCFDLAMKCYIIGRYDDARVVLSHALAQVSDARYYYVRGTLEMLTGHAADAKMSALGYLANASQPLSFSRHYVYERVNGPAAIQFRHLAGELAIQLSPPPAPAVTLVERINSSR